MILTSPAKLIAQYLVDQGVAVHVGGGDWTVYVSQLADTPDNAICVYDDGATQDGRIAGGERIEHPRFHIRVRGKDYGIVWDKGIAILTALDALLKTNVLVGGDTFVIHSVMRADGLTPFLDTETGLNNVTLDAEMTVSFTAP